jgi:hypothetical protein
MGGVPETSQAGRVPAHEAPSRRPSIRAVPAMEPFHGAAAELLGPLKIVVSPVRFWASPSEVARIPHGCGRRPRSPDRRPSHGTHDLRSVAFIDAALPPGLAANAIGVPTLTLGALTPTSSASKIRLATATRLRIRRRGKTAGASDTYRQRSSRLPKG